ncbi:MAG: T9SS sorting signal type C domain-containing protein [Flavobacterium sp. JAD_PAG50586_2]|nr:MAG: T9SS sorting signal type C domain-containing protein [Flavobacterium sp. JAD_PAG50586_2]
MDGIEEKDRLWLNLMNADGMFGQQLIGYFDETTLGFDWAYDGRVNQSNNYVSFYSIAGNEKYKIQARPSFDPSDIVPLGYFSAVTGEFTIGIDKKEGIFNLEETPIYVEDKEMNIIHNLKESPYTFTTNYGRFENRFVLRYTDAALGNPDFETLDSSVSVASNHGELLIKSHIENIEDVIVYDILGRQLFESKNIANNNFTASNISNSKQTLIVKIKLANGFTVSRKIIL